MMLPRKRNLLLISAAAILLLSVIFFVVQQKNFRQAKTHREQMEFHFEPNKNYLYNVLWNSKQKTRIFVSGNSTTEKDLVIDGNIKWQSKLILRLQGSHNGIYTLAGLFRNFENTKIEVQQKDLTADPAVLASMEQKPFYFDMDVHGRILAFRFEDSSSDLHKQMTRSLFAEFQVRFPEKEEEWLDNKWEIDEVVGPGTAKTRYELSLNGESGYLKKERVHYSNVAALYSQNLQSIKTEQSSKTDVIFAPPGFVEKYYANELFSAIATNGAELVTYQSTLDLSFQGFEDQIRVILLPMEKIVLLNSIAPDSATRSKDIEQKMLDQRIGNIDIELIKKQYQVFALSRMSEDRNRFVWQATGYLIKYPEKARELAPLFRGISATTADRSLILDLLANSGTSIGQEVLRTLLVEETTRSRKEEYASLYQRLTFLEHPTEETVAFVSKTHTEAKENQDRSTAMASLYTMGAFAGNLFRSGESDAALSLNEKIIDDLKDAQNDDDRATIIAAVGNAGLPQNIPLLAQESNQSNPRIRQAVATSLRKTETPEAREVVQKLIDDPEAAVQKAAIETLSRYKPTEESLQTIATSVTSGKMKPQVYGAVLSYIEQSKTPINSSRPILEYIMQHEDKDMELRAYIRMMLEGASAN